MRPGARVVDAENTSWDETYDIVVVGAGAGGFATAVNAARIGSHVAILEKASEPGGTMLKSAAWYWIPNNSHMREDGKPDSRDAFLRYAARLSRPQAYDPTDDHLGLSEWEYETVGAIYEYAGVANDTLAEMGAIRPLYSPAIPDYHSTIPEAEVPFGRTLQIDRGDGEMGKGGVMTEQLRAACDRLGVPILLEHRVESVVVDDDAVVGVVATHGGAKKHVRATQAVVFATGGFTHSRELRRNFLSPVIVSGCAAPTNEGDFVHIATALGLPLRNMNFAWMAPIPYEIALQGSPYLSGIFATPGDSMIWVDKYGKRVVNEKTIYNELALSFLQYDPAKLEYPRLLMFMVWDQRTMDLARPVDEQPPTTPPRLALDNYGNIVYDDFHVISGESFDELTSNVEARLEKLAPKSGGFKLDPSFRQNLATSVARFNELARSGKDEDFHRGENPIELIFNGPAKDGNETGNPTMYPISETGPYYATIVCAGTLDTKGGPPTNTNGQVLDVDGNPVQGLYAVGNCAANATGQAYLAGGGTIGPFFTFGYLAAEHAARQPRR
jgi:predicted oxidoreductase